MITDTKLIKFMKTAKSYLSTKNMKNMPESKIFDNVLNMAERIQKLAYVNEGERKEALEVIWSYYEKVLNSYNKKAKYSKTAVDETWAGAERSTSSNENSYKIANSTGGYEVSYFGNELESIVGAELYGDKAKGVTSIKRNKDDE